MKVKARAKLNLNLHLLPKKLNNGLYPVKFINCELNLSDELFFEKIDNNIRIIANNQNLPEEKDNLIYKAANLLKQFAKNKKIGVEIFLQKNIPIKAGLGGGSSDAAAALKALIKLWKIEIDKKQLWKITEQLGKDVYYSLVGGVCEISNDGSLVKKLNYTMPKIYLVIITPNEDKPSTGYMYKNLSEKKIGKHLNYVEKLKKAIRNEDQIKIMKNLYNDFETLATQNFPVVEKIKQDLLKEKALKTLLAGSGLSIVGFFKNKKTTINAFNNLKVIYKKILWTVIN